MINDTICAISTAVHDAGINIIRVSGDDAIEITNSVFKGKNLTKVSSHTIHYGYIIDDNKNIIDEVLVSVFKAPRTFTKEDVCEINCHGGRFVTNKILELLLRKGARLALKGEFTKRAYMNGRIDLLKAEAIMDIIEADNDISLNLAKNKLFGNTSNMINDFRSLILNLVAKINVSIDYPEYDDEVEVTNEIIKPEIEVLKTKINKIIENAKKGNLLKNGIKTLILGKPNSGKSSILNMMLQEEKAIVTNIPGTTRDVVEGYINLNGIKLHLLDTAGIRETIDVVERIGVEKSRSLINEAHLVLLVIDNANITEDDYKLIKETNNKKRIIILNKSDLNENINSDIKDLENVILLSTLKPNESLEILEKTILKVIEINNLEKDHELNYLTNTRHIACLEKALQSINDCITSIEIQNPLEFIELDLKNAYNVLGEIIGDTYKDSLLDEMFSKFCLGK
jgi:tRNA modification GTPase